MAWVAYYFKLNPFQLDDEELAPLIAMAEYIGQQMQPKKQ